MFQVIGTYYLLDGWTYRKRVAKQRRTNIKHKWIIWILHTESSFYSVHNKRNYDSPRISPPIILDTTHLEVLCKWRHKPQVDNQPYSSS